MTPELIRLIAAGALAAAGLLLVFGGAFGVVRFTDVFARVHAVRAASLGAPLVLAGIAIETWELGAALRLLLLAVVIAATGPAVAHLIAQAAHRAGDSPEPRR